MPEPLEVPIDSIARVTTVLGERCRVVVETTAAERTISVTTDEGHICTYKGQMDFSWVLNGEPHA